MITIMIDARYHYISIDPQILSRNWRIYQSKYQEIEANLPRYSQVPPPFYFKTHPLGGFFVPRKTPDSPLKDLFENSQYHFLLSHAGRRYSRGMFYYPGLFKDHSDIERIGLIIASMNRIINAYVIESSRFIPGSVYPLIAQDYIRNYLLILYHAFHVIAHRDFLVQSSEDGNTNSVNKVFKSVIFQNELDLFKYATNPDAAPPYLAVDEIRELCVQLRVYFEKRKSLIEGSSQKIIRESREVDNLAHIYSFAQKVSRCHLSNDTLMLGLEYGGIELPFAVNAVRVMQLKSALPFATVRLSNYSSSSQVPIRNLEDILSCDGEKHALNNAAYVLILDDSTTTGRSLQRTIDLLPSHIICAHIGVVTFRASNRYHHLTMPAHGGFNPVIARNSIILCRSNYTSTYKKNSYLNRAGIFDLTKYNLYRILGREAV